MSLASRASELHTFTLEADIVQFLKQRLTTSGVLPLFVLSGGSNVLLPPMLRACVIRPDLRGISAVKETDTHVWVAASAGEYWHEFVMHCLENGWYGLENLALIPGLVGAAPVQNIGAYGVEIKDHFTELTAINLVTGERRAFAKDACQFAYRDSFFKQNPNQWLITQVVFKLHKSPNLVLGYGDVARKAAEIAGGQPTPKAVAEAIIGIRQSKLPNPKTTPNCGSFFKNPVVNTDIANRLLQSHPNMPHYPQAGNMVKLAAGWLIDQAGLKGYTQGSIGTHKDQALVLVNHAKGVATQDDIANFAKLVQAKVNDIFGVALEREPVWVRADGSLA